MAYTNDLTDKWGGEWLAWDGCGKFWAQAIRGILRNNSVDGIEVTSKSDSEIWRFDVRRTADDGQSLNGLRWDAVAFDENGREEPLEVQEVGLGRYQATVPIAGRDRITVRLRDADHDKTSIQHFNRPYPVEYRLTQETPPALAALPQLGAETIVADVNPHTTRHSVADYAYFSALASLVASILCRRL